LILCAPDSFKGSLSAARAARAMAAGAGRALPGEEVRLAPLADGGEGTVEALLQALGGEEVLLSVPGPLGEVVEAFYGLLPGGETAVIETAAASGLLLVPPERRDVLRASTFGTGRLIASALDEGARRILVGLGGSATCDGGAGMAQALGFSLLDEEGRELPPGGGALVRLHRIDPSGAHPALKEARIQGACDVEAPLLGPRGAAAVFAPQKGAGPEEVKILEAGLARLAEVLKIQFGRHVADLPGAGAAGGLGAGLAGFLGAELKPGFQLVAQAIDLEKKIQGARLVLTGEGRLDGQTSLGKAPAGVIRLCRRLGTPVLALAGELGPGWRTLLEEGLISAFPICPGPVPLEEAKRRAAEYLTDATERALRAFFAPWR